MISLQGDTTFLSDGFAIHGKLAGTHPQGVLLLHPHPAMGGTMDYPLLYHLSRILSTNFTVLRFNFRGVGQSDGKYSGDGRGELRDAQAGFNHLKNVSRGDYHPHVIGYSFGGSTAIALASREKIGKLVCFSPSLSILETMTNESTWKINTDEFLLFHGDYDDIITRKSIEKLIEKLNTSKKIRFERVNTDHFYGDPDLRHSVIEQTISFLNQ